MAQLRKDPVTNRWIIVNVERPSLPESFARQETSKSSRTCPFCPGNETMTPPPILTMPQKNPPKNTAPWQVRVVPNKFPALKIEESNERSAVGIYDKIGGFGAHEVIIENPDHEKEIEDLSLEDLSSVLKCFKERCLDLRKDSRFKYILLFKNHGEAAGASLEHPHSQLIALPIVPSRVLSEIKGAEKHYEHTERCLFCDMVNQDSSKKTRVLYEENGFTAFLPFASRFPFETWVLPKKHEANFDALADENLLSLAKALKTALSKIKLALKNPAYNLMIHTLPLSGKEVESYHWHIEIIPHLTRVAGFELGTGFYLNPTPPELAAEILRNHKI